MKEREPKIKIRSKNLRKKTDQQLIQMKEEMVMHVIQGKVNAHGDKLSKGFNLKQEGRNIARINTILNERK